MKLKSKIYALLLCGLVVTAPSTVEGKTRRKARAKRQTSKVIPKPVSAQKAQINPVGGLTASQKQAARLALKDLLKLRLALDSKLPRNDLKTRMLDVESTVQDASLDLPKGVMKDQITGATSLYKQALTVWGEVEEKWQREESIRDSEFDAVAFYASDAFMIKLLRNQREDKEAVELGKRLAPVSELFSKASDLLSKAEKSFEQQN